LILPLDATIDIKVITPKPATILSADGQGLLSEIARRRPYHSRRSRRPVRLMHLAGVLFAKLFAASSIGEERHYELARPRREKRWSLSS